MSTDKRTAHAIDELQMWGQRVAARLSRHRKRFDIHSELERLDISLAKDDPRVVRILDEIKTREARGYIYDGADASFELIARGHLGEIPSYFVVESCDITDVHGSARGSPAVAAEASMLVHVSGDRDSFRSTAVGARPMEAIERALREALGCYQQHLKELEFVDYEVSLLARPDGPVTRVRVESRSRATGEHWFTVGAAPNILDASREALVDSINYMLLKGNAEVSQALAS